MEYEVCRTLVTLSPLNEVHLKCVPASNTLDHTRQNLKVRTLAVTLKSTLEKVFAASQNFYWPCASAID